MRGKSKIRNVSNFMSLRDKRERRKNFHSKRSSLKIFFYPRYIATSMTSMKTETLLKMNFLSVACAQFVYTFLFLLLCDDREKF